MKNVYKNTPHFLKEARTIFRIDLLSNIFSIFSIGLILFILSLIVAGWWISNDIVQVIEQETEISIYFDEDLHRGSIDDLLVKVGNIDGINQANLVSEDESYNRMVDILGQEARILGYFDENPFSQFIELKIEIEALDNILHDIESIDDIDYIRDNRQVIEKLQGIKRILEMLALFLLIAVGVSSVVIVSHIIRQGIYNNRDEINTLRLLGAPDYFIQIPFFIEGIFLTIAGGSIASLMWALLIKYGYTNINNILPFFPLAPANDLQWIIILFIIVFSFIIGLMGSVFGLKSIRKQDHA